MHRVSKDWSVVVEPRQDFVSLGDGRTEPLNGYVDVVVITMADGYTVEMLINRAGITERDRLRSVQVTGPGIAQKDLCVLPIVTLQAVAEAALKRYDEGLSQEFAADVARAEASRHTQEDKGVPGPVEFARIWRETPARIERDGERVTRRKLLAEQYGVTVWRIDQVSRAARDRGLIPKQRAGRPRLASTTINQDNDQHDPSNEQKGTRR